MGTELVVRSVGLKQAGTLVPVGSPGGVDPLVSAPAGNGAASAFAVRSASLRLPWQCTLAASVAPSAPTIGTATGGDASASVAFTPAGSGAAATSYRAISSPGSITATGTSSPITVPGLTNGTAYTFTVRAQNAAGNSAESASSNSVTPSGGPTTLASDTFTRADAGALGTATTGGTWTTDAGWSIVSNKGVGNQASWSVASLDPATADVTVEVDFTFGTSKDCGLVARMTDASNLLYLNLTDNSSTEMAGNIFRRSGGVFTALGTLFTIATTVGTVHTVELICSGTSLTAKVDGATVATGTDATQAGTRAGLAVSSGTAHTFDNFLVTTP